VGQLGVLDIAIPQIRKYRNTAILQNNSLHTAILQEGGVEIFGFADLASFWFSFRNQKLRFFGFAGFRCLVRFAGFLQFSLCFSVFVNHNGGFFRFFCQLHFTVFLVLSRKLHPAVQLYHKSSLFNLAATIWVVMAAKQTMKKLKITSKPKTISPISHSLDNIRYYNPSNIFARARLV